MVIFLLFFPPQHNYLAQVTSNIWGTKFKIVGLAAFLPTNLGAGKPCMHPTGNSGWEINFDLQWPEVKHELLRHQKISMYFTSKV